jgi:chromosome segregation ATPase
VNIKAMAMMVAAGCAVGMLTGCGIPEEEHNAKIAELNTAWQEIESLKGKNTDLDSLFNSEKAKLRTARIELEDTITRLKGSQKKEAVTASALASEKSTVAGLEKEVSSAKSATMRAKEETVEVEATLVALEEEHDALQVRFDQFNRNMQALSGAPTETAAPVVVVEELTLEEMVAEQAPTKPKTALDLLNEMGAQ